MDPGIGPDSTEGGFERTLVRGVALGWLVTTVIVFLIAIAFGADAVVAVIVAAVIGVFVGGGLGLLYGGRAAGSRHS